MFDMIGYALKAGVNILAGPSGADGMACLEVRDPRDGFAEKTLVPAESDDAFLQGELDRLVAVIGRRKAGYYSARQKSHELREREKLFRGE